MPDYTQQFSNMANCAVTEFRITAIFGTIANDANEWAGKIRKGEKNRKVRNFAAV